MTPVGWPRLLRRPSLTNGNPLAVDFTSRASPAVTHRWPPFLCPQPAAVMTTAGLVLIGALIFVGLLGILVPAVPGALLVVVAILIWASEQATAGSWVVFGIAAAAVAVTQVAKYTVPGRRMVSGGVPRTSMLFGLALGIVGFFVVPVIGLFLGFVLGVFAAERRRLADRRSALAATRSAVRAVSLSVVIELGGALTAAAAWLVGVLFT
jgi:uncharacterized protein